MAYEHLITADWHDKDVFTSAGGPVARSDTTARTGTWAFLLPNGTNISQSVVAAATKCIGFGFHLPSSDNDGYRLFYRESLTEHLCFLFNTASGTIEARRGSESGTLLGSGGTITTNRWYFVGIKATIDNAAGVVEVWLDGVKVIDLSSQDTQNGGTATVNNFQWFVTGANDMRIDDIKVRDDAVPGVGGVDLYLPSADGSDTGWTASAGNRFQCVDEAPATYTDYVSTDVATTGTKSTFAHAGMTAAAYEAIDCVCVAAVAKLDGAGAGNVRSIVKSNATYANGSAVAMSTTSKYVHLFTTVDPNTAAAWGKAGVDAVNFGVETI